jgi:hypothetical protein
LQGLMEAAKQPRQFTFRRGKEEFHGTVVLENFFLGAIEFRRRVRVLGVPALWAPCAVMLSTRAAGVHHRSPSRMCW